MSRLKARALYTENWLKPEAIFMDRYKAVYIVWKIDVLLVRFDVLISNRGLNDSKNCMRKSKVSVERISVCNDIVK